MLKIGPKDTYNPDKRARSSNGPRGGATGYTGGYTGQIRTAARERPKFIPNLTAAARVNKLLERTMIHRALRLRYVRLTRGLSQDALATLTGIPQSRLSLGERGRLAFTARELAALARALGVDRPRSLLRSQP